MTPQPDPQISQLEQLTRSVASLAHSLERSEQQNRRMQKILFGTVTAMLIGIFGLFTAGTSWLPQAHASNFIDRIETEIKDDVNKVGDLEQSLKQLLEELGPALEDMAVLLHRVRQDSDVVRGSQLMRKYPGHYPNLASIPPQALNSADASEALLIGSIAQEIRFLNTTMTQMNHNMALMTRDVNDTMGVMGDFMP